MALTAKEFLIGFVREHGPKKSQPVELDQVYAMAPENISKTDIDAVIRLGQVSSVGEPDRSKRITSYMNSKGTLYLFMSSGYHD